jgi:mannose-6-phosphate isomerase-like protein (cupin superfamily)
MGLEIIDIDQRTRMLQGVYENALLDSVNDHSIRISMMTEPYFWHHHPNSDETFLVVEGTVIIDLEERRIELHTGQMFTIPRGVIHRTQPHGARSVNLTIERSDIETVRVDR